MDQDAFRRLSGQILRLAAHRLVAGFEPDKNTYRVRHGHVAAITRILSKLGHDQVIPFKTPKGRDTFLWAAHKHLDPVTTHEELLVGFGKRRGRARSAGSSVEFVYRAVGDRTRLRSPRSSSVSLRRSLLKTGQK